MGRGIYTRGYLPHWDFARAVQAVTFRLADSIPAAVMAGWQRELAAMPEGKARDNELRRRIARHEDIGEGEAVLGRAECAEEVQSKLLAGHDVAYKLIEWCIMPNHVHVLCKLEGSSRLADVLQRWKGASAVEINRLLGRRGALWQREYHDRLVRDMEHFHDCRIYIRENPVKAGLCERPEDWRFSSAGGGWLG